MDFKTFTNLTLAQLIDVSQNINSLDAKDVSQYYHHIKQFAKQLDGLSDTLRTKILELDDNKIDLSTFGIDIRLYNSFQYGKSIENAKKMGLKILTRVIPEREEVDSAKMKALFRKDEKYKKCAEYKKSRSVYTK